MNKLKPVEKLDDQKPQLDDESYRFFANAIIFVGIFLIVIGIANWPDPTGNTVEASVSYWTRLGTIGDFVAGVGGHTIATTYPQQLHAEQVVAIIIG